MKTFLLIILIIAVIQNFREYYNLRDMDTAKEYLNSKTEEVTNILTSDFIDEKYMNIIWSIIMFVNALFKMIIYCMLISILL